MRRKAVHVESTSHTTSTRVDVDKDRHNSVDRRGDIEAAVGEHEFIRTKDDSDSEKTREWRIKENARVVLCAKTFVLCVAGLFVGISIGEHYSELLREVQHPARADGSEFTHGETNKILPPPNGWEHFSRAEIHQHFSCNVHAQDQSKPLHTLETWTLFREKYAINVDADFKFDDPIPPTEGYSIDIAHLLPPPFVANFSPGKGRGVFATRNIEKGELVHDGNRSAMQFTDTLAWRRFVFSLPRKMACDIAEWSWTQKLSAREKTRVLVDLNISAFFNSGWSKRSNVGPKESTSLKFYATEDIAKGAELLYNYGVYSTDWHGIGL